LTARRELIDQRIKIISLQNMRAVTAAQLYYAYGGGSDNGTAENQPVGSEQAAAVQTSSLKGVNIK
jgi:outer membrane protein TolC